MNTAIFSPNGGSVGIGFAVPASLAGDIVAELKSDGAVERGRLGVRVQQMGDDLAAGLGLDKAEGALVASVDPSGPAAGAGLMAGDVILEVDGKRVGEMRRLPRMIAARDPGDTVTLKFWRNREIASAKVVLDALPASGKVAEASATTGGFAGLDLGEADGKVVVAQVAPGSPAARKGMRKGDVLVSVDRRPVATPDRCGPHPCRAQIVRPRVRGHAHKAGEPGPVRGVAARPPPDPACGRPPVPPPAGGRPSLFGPDP